MSKPRMGHIGHAAGGRYRGRRSGDAWEAEPPSPPFADEVLALLAGRFRPGDAVGIDDMIGRPGMTPERAASIRRWALAVGAWPYLDPTPSRAGRWA